MFTANKECGFKCRSKAHISYINNGISKCADTRPLQLLASQCYGFMNHADLSGKTVLQMAVSCGRYELVEWLLNNIGVDINLKDLESGWTALHRALFYGQVAEARLLISKGANIQSRDKDGLTPLDLLMKDLRLIEGLPHTISDLEVYTWGENSNFNLGLATGVERKTPEPVEWFRKQHISIKQVLLMKFHTVFLGYCGRVWTSGHGQGGRLGHGNAQTCMSPKQVSLPSACVQIAASTDHTLMVLNDGTLYGCGHNTYQQLGITTLVVETPKQVPLKPVQGRDVLGICTHLYHTVIYTKDQVFTFGLNAGQLGHKKVVNQPFISHPLLVSRLTHSAKAPEIRLVVCSQAATIVYIASGDVFSLNQYQCKRVLSKWPHLTHIAVQGGELDQSVQADTVKDYTTEALTLAMINSIGKVFLWRANCPSALRVIYDVKRAIDIRSLSLTVNSMALVTTEGDAFIAALPKELKVKGELSSSVSLWNRSVLADPIPREAVVEVNLKKVPLVHRAVNIVSDRRARNFAVLQAHPSTSLLWKVNPDVSQSCMQEDLEALLADAHQDDVVHDVLLKVGHEIIPAHRLILATRSAYFRDLFTNQDITRQAAVDMGVDNPEIFMQVLLYIYTSTCDLLTPHTTISFTYLHRDLQRAGLPDETNQDHVKANRLNDGKTNMKKKKKKIPPQEEIECNIKNPVHLLRSMAKKFGLIDLEDSLKAVEWKNNHVELVGNGRVTYSSITFSRTSFPHLCDITLKCANGVHIQAHRCVLVARLEYFRCMLASDWIESSSTSEIAIPIDADLMGLVLDFLYNDSVPDSLDFELLYNLLIIAGQLLAIRLQELCEEALCAHVHLKTCCDLLELALTYNAPQLAKACKWFICLNLGHLLESRSMDNMSLETLKDLGSFYRKEFLSSQHQDQRKIPASSEPPLLDYLQELVKMYENVGLEDPQILKKITSGKSKRRSKGSLSEDDIRPKDRTISTCSDSPEGPNEVKQQLAAVSELTSQYQQYYSRSITTPTLSQGVDCSTTTLSPAVNGSTTILNPTVNGSTTTLSPKVNGSTPLLSPALTGSSTSLSPAASLSTVNVKTTDEAMPGRRSLREIMNEEENDTLTPAKKLGFSCKKTEKLSQKERKKLAQRNCNVEEANEKAQISLREATSLEMKPVWGVTVPLTDGSFRQIMHSQEASQLTTVKQQPNHEKLVNTESLMASSPPASSNPWKLAVSPVQKPSSPLDSGLCLVHSFTKIVEDEIQMHTSLEQAKNKPLALIQIEEQAIQELYRYYKEQENDPSVRITVERVSPAMATPTWAAKQKPKR